MTLVEVMIVIVLLAMAAAGTVYAVSALTRSELRAGCMKIAAGSRFAYSRAVTHNTTVRIVLDFEADRMWFEEAHGRITLARTDDPTRLEVEREGDEETVAVDPWRAASERLSETFRPSFGGSPFQALRGPSGQVLTRYQAQPIGPRGVLSAQAELVRLVTPHEPEPREEGRGAIYFFPQGRTEHAIIQLSDGEETVYTVEILPLTGRATVYNYAYMPDRLADEEASEVDDPG